MTPTANAITGVEVFCPATDQAWSAAPSLPEARSRFAGVGVIGRRIYAAAGTDAAGYRSDALFIYDSDRGWRRSPEPIHVPMGCGAGTVASTDTVRVVDVIPAMITAGSRVAVTPVGMPSALRLTVPAKLPVRVMDAVMLPEAPCSSDTAAAERETEKPPGGAEGVPLSPPPQPALAAAIAASATQRGREPRNM